MGILAWIIIGVVAAVIAKAIVPGNEPGGFLSNLVIGVLGAIAGGWIMNAFGRAGVTGLNLHSLLVAVIGTVVLLFLYHAVTGKPRTIKS